MRMTLLLGLGALCLSACATTSESNLTETRMEGNNLIVKEGDIYDKEKHANLSEAEKDQKIICKKFDQTGTNTRRKDAVCKTRGEWKKEYEGAQTAIAKWNARGTRPNPNLGQGR